MIVPSGHANHGPPVIPQIADIRTTVIIRPTVWNGLCTSNLNLITPLRCNEIHGQRDSFSKGTLSVSPREPPVPHPCPWRKMINLSPKVNHVLKMFLLENKCIIWWQESSFSYLTGILWTTKTSSGWWVNHRTSGYPAPQCEIKTKNLQ